MTVPFKLPFTIPVLSRANTWRTIAGSLLALLGALLVADAFIFVRYGLGWASGVTTQQFIPVSLDSARLDDAIRVVGKREDVRATRDYGPKPKNLFK